jgi:single-strand DNA-binding protein
MRSASKSTRNNLIHCLILKKHIMSTLRNRVQLIGNLGSAPEIKTLDGGKKLAKLNLATNETHKNQKGEKVTETTWHNLVIWGPLAEVAEKYLEKGMEIAVDGKLQNNNYTDKEGVKRYSTDIVVSDFVMLGKKS